MSHNNEGKKLGPISMEYALHIPHVMRAREIFESEIKVFQNDVTNKLLETFNTLEHETLGFSISHNKKNSRTTGSCIITSFNNEQSFSVYYKGPKKHRKAVGYLHSRILFDDARKIFAWKFYFKNSDSWDDQIDERCRQVIDNMDKELSKVLTNHKYYESDVYSFFMIPITESFRVNDFKVLELSSEILVEAMMHSKEYVSFEDDEAA